MDILYPLLILNCRMSLVFLLLVAFHTFFGFLYFHGLMASNALLMIGSEESGLHEVHFIKRLAVTGDATRRFHACRAVVVAALADRGLVIVEVGSQFASLLAPIHSLDKARYNHPVREGHPFILVDKTVYRDLFRDLLHRVGSLHRLSGLKKPLRQRYLSFGG
jgi:hypothetical protein